MSNLNITRLYNGIISDEYKEDGLVEKLSESFQINGMVKLPNLFHAGIMEGLLNDVRSLHTKKLRKIS